MEYCLKKKKKKFHGAVLFENKASFLRYMADTYGRGRNFPNESGFTEIAWQGSAEKKQQQDKSPEYTMLSKEQ